jgi:hypothetical protein
MTALLLAAAILTLEQLAWMSGSWSGADGEVAMEEHWTAAAGGVMLGMHLDAAPGKKAFFEFLRIEQRDDGVVYVAMPRGRSETEFRLVAASAGRAVFENPQHDFPQRIIYWRDGESLCARIEGPSKGEDRAEQWCWERAARK